jgi:37-kD nucleoid-associated bacterial protein
MIIAGVEVVRLIAHEIVKASQLNDRPPILSDEIMPLDQHGKDLLAKRLVSTIASGNHCVDVDVVESEVNSPFDHTASLLDHDDAGFIEATKKLASALSAAQTAGAIKAGSGIFIQGKCMVNAVQKRFAAIIKADSDQAFRKQVDGENSIVLQYVNEMVLGESQKLFKIALFLEDVQSQARGVVPIQRTPDQFTIKVFDHNMQMSGNANAATYFYSTFLKCRLAENAPRLTKQFFNVARDFLDARDELRPQEKMEYRADLISYLRGNRQTLEARTFAQEVLPENLRDPFVKQLQEAGLGDAVAKDLSLLKGKLRRQSIRFSSEITIYGQPETLRDSVKIGQADAEGWTDLKIKGSVQEIP